MKRFFGLLMLSLAMLSAVAPVAHAQMAVIDPANLVENIRSAVYGLQSVNNQLAQLENEARMLQNEGKNLTSLDYNNLTRLRVTLATTTRLLQEADGLAYSVTGTDAGLSALYPAAYSAADSLDQMAAAERTRQTNSRDAAQTALRVQAQAYENMAADTDTLSDTIGHSQAAVGQLQATQSTNQLLALQVRQALQAQQLQITHDRAQAVEQARLAAMTTQTREMQRRFLGDGTHYSTTAVDFYSH